MRARLLALVLPACAPAPAAQRVDLPAPPPAPAHEVALPRESTLTIASAQPGVLASIDGVDAGPLPISMRHVEPGAHVVRLEGARYEPRELRVSIAPNESMMMHETLVVARGRATLVLVTPGATVELVSGSDRRSIAQLPIAIEIGREKKWTIEATKPGYRPYEMPIRFDDGVPEKTFEIELAK